MSLGMRLVTPAADLGQALGADPLPLRDVHLPPSPPWWPPAPGWWLLFAGLLLILGIVFAWRWRVRRRRRALARFFDDTVDAASDPPARIAAMSELLRRAVRERDPQAATLTGDAWLAHLDAGRRSPVFAAGLGRSLLEDGFRREVPESEYRALRVVVRERFLELAMRRRPGRAGGRA
jgi:hypothetical protein